MDDSENDAAELTKDSFEGRYRPYTVAVISAGTLVLVVLVWERGLYEEKEELFFGLVRGVSLGRTAMWLLRTVTIIFWAIVDGLICWWILLPNLRDLRKEPTDHYMSMSIASLILMNLAGVAGVFMSRGVFTGRDLPRLMDVAAHYFLLTMAVVMLVAMDVYFVAVIHIRYREIVVEFMHMCTGQEFATTHRPGSGFSLASKRKQPLWKRCLSSHGVLCLIMFGCTIDLLIILPTQIIVFLLGVLGTVLWRWLLYPCLMFPIGLVLWTCENLKKWRRIPLQTSPNCHPKYRGGNGGLEYSGNRRSSSTEFKHSAWVLGAVTTSFILLIYMGLRIGSETERFIQEVYIPSRVCVSCNAGIQREILRMIGYGGRYLPVDANATKEDLVDITLGRTKQYGMTIAIRPDEAEDIFNYVVDDMVMSSNHMTRFLGRVGEVFLGPPQSDYVYSCRGQKMSSSSLIPILNLVNSSLAEPGDPTAAFQSTFEGHVVTFFDSFVMHLRWSFPVALAAGILVGFLTLLKMLHAYKHTLLAINAIYSGRDIPPEEDPPFVSDTRHPRSRLINLAMKDRDCIEGFYSMPRSVFFFGVMMSTAILEFTISYFFLASFLAGIASCIEAYEVFHPFLGIAAASAGTWVVDMLIVRSFIGKMITRRGYKVKHPNLWLMFWIVGSIWHLVLGVLIAVIRFIITAISTIMELSRLDLNLYPASIGLDRFDIAEAAFGSMIMIHNQVLLREEELNRTEIPKFQFKSVAFSIMGARKMTGVADAPSTSSVGNIYQQRQ